MDESPPLWKFWWPMPLGQVLGVYVLAMVCVQLLGVALREGLGIGYITTESASSGASIGATIFVIHRARGLRGLKG